MLAFGRTLIYVVEVEVEVEGWMTVFRNNRLHERYYVISSSHVWHIDNAMLPCMTLGLAAGDKYRKLGIERVEVCTR